MTKIALNLYVLYGRTGDGTKAFRFITFQNLKILSAIFVPLVIPIPRLLGLYYEIETSCNFTTRVYFYSI